MAEKQNICFERSSVPFGCFLSFLFRVMESHFLVGVGFFCLPFDSDERHSNWGVEIQGPHLSQELMKVELIARTHERVPERTWKEGKWLKLETKKDKQMQQMIPVQKRVSLQQASDLYWPVALLARLVDRTIPLCELVEHM
jgi:hypothetical protein